MRWKMRDYGWKWSGPCRHSSGAANKSPQLRGEIIFSAETLEDLSTKLLCCSGDILVHPGLHTLVCVWWLSTLLRDARLFFCLHMLQRFPGRFLSHRVTAEQAGKESPSHSSGLSSSFFLPRLITAPSLIPNEDSRPPTYTPTNPPTHTLLCTYFTETHFYKDVSSLKCECK